nr:Proteinase inhibitor I2 domain containing protein [Haemonchus contortus]
MRCITLHRVLMVTTILTFSCYVNGLQCYWGGDAYYTIAAVRNQEACTYEARPACNFTKEKYATHRIQKLAEGGTCWYQSKYSMVICFCDSDMCNGNFTILLELWKQKTMDNPEIYECALEHFKSKQALVEEEAVPLEEYKANIPTDPDHETPEGPNDIESSSRHPDANPCVLPPDLGSPDDDEGVAQEMWYFNESQASCAPFEYLGSGGNTNRFVDEVTCMRVCGTEYVSAVHGEAHHRAGEEDVSAVHDEAYHRAGEEDVSAVHDEAHHRAGEEGVSAVHGEPYHGAGEANHALCDLPLQSGNGTFRIPRFYFNKGDGKCEPFYYTGDGGNGNRFLTEEDCRQLCFANRYNQELASPQGQGVDSSDDEANALDR